MKRIAVYGWILLFLLFCGCAAVPEAPDTTPAATPTMITEPTPTAEPTTTPEPTPEPTPAPLDFSVDPHKIPADQKAFLEDAQALEDFCVLMDAVFLRETQITCTTASAAKAAAEVFAATPYSACAAMTVEEHQIHLAYAETVSPADVNAAVCTMVQETVLESSTPLEIMLKLYRTVSGFEYAETEENNLCHTLLSKSGGPKELAATLQFLFAQTDIPAWLAEGKAGNMTHYWVIAEYDGVLYHFDPVFENGATAGTGLSCFGMSDQAHQSTGCAADYRTGFPKFGQKANDLCADPRFDDLFPGVTSWSLNETEHTLTLTYNFDPAAQIEISTTE